MEAALPDEFTSWPQVLTDWGVIGAFQKVGLPPCLKGHPKLAVPLVVEISQAIRRNRLCRESSRVAMLQETVLETTIQRAVGPSHLELQERMEEAQERYVRGLLRTRSRIVGDEVDPDIATLHAEMVSHQTEFEASRRKHAALAWSARKAAARKYWAACPARSIPDTFFADAPVESAAARMQRIHPPWWGAFLRCLQQTLAHGHPAEGHLLDELPRLRAEARVKTFAAMVAEWQEAHADQWGWYGLVHHRMLAIRAMRKADQVKAWFDAVAPGYLADGIMREQLHEALWGCLEEADPWSGAVLSAGAFWGTASRN